MFSSTASRPSAPLGFGLTLLAASVAVGAALLIGPGTARADDGIADEAAEPATEAVVDVRYTDPPSDLEAAFWRCDHAATRYGVDLGLGSACSAITEELKATKFGGDFEALLAWWQQRRDQEHAALDVEGDPRAVP